MIESYKFVSERSCGSFVVSDLREKLQRWSKIGKIVVAITYQLLVRFQNKYNEIL